MNIHKLLSVFKASEQTDVSEVKINLCIQQVNYISAGREAYIAERNRLISTIGPPESDPEGKGHFGLVFEQFSYEECWALFYFPDGRLVVLSDKGKKISSVIRAPFPKAWIEMEVLMEKLLPQTCKRDDFPLTGFGHATFFFVSGRNIFVSKKHIPLMEKESNGFHSLHKNLLFLRQLIMEKL